jgi:site-specific DNA recombinase
LTGRKKSVEWNNIKQLHALIKKVKRGIARLVDAYQDGLIDKTEFEPRIHKTKQRLTKLQAEANRQADEQAQQRELRLVIGRMKEFAHRVSNNLEEAEWMTKREIIRALVKQIDVDEKAVRIVYRVDPPPFCPSP